MTDPASEPVPSAPAEATPARPGPPSVAVPGLVVGGIGLGAGILGLSVGRGLFGLVAGLLALTAGVIAYRSARRLEEQGALQRLVEDELRTVRAEARANETELRAEIESMSALLGPDPDDPFLGDPDPEDAEFVEALDAALDDVAAAHSGPGAFTDALTGLFSEDYFIVALNSRVAAARRHLRPVAVVLIEVVTGLPADDPRMAGPDVVAEAITKTLREADTASRLRSGIFTLLLEDTPENGAIWTVERIRRHLAEHQPGLTLRAGVACYPAHAFGAAELVRAAGLALDSAREWRQDRIEVALAVAD